MNPQQFANNMGGMGRGMPNMGMPGQMNNMNMGNMGMMGGNMGMPGGMNNMAGLQQQQQQQQQRAPQYITFIYQSLAQQQQQDGPPQGWRASVTTQERAAQIKLLFDSLRMLGQPQDIKRSLDIALAFEKKQFTQCQSHDHYKEEMRQKLSNIRDQRQLAVNNNNMPGMNMAQQQQQMSNNMNSGIGGFGNLNMGTPQMPGQQMNQQQANIQNNMNVSPLCFSSISGNKPATSMIC